MKSYHLTSLLSVAIASLTTTVLSGCESTSTDNSQPVYQEPVISNQALVNQLMKYNWHLKSAIDANKQTLTDISQVPEPAQLNFSQRGKQSSYGLYIGCNRINSSIKIQNNVLSSEGMRSTEMYCKDLSKAEQQLKTLMRGKSQLTISTSTNNAILKQITENASTLTWRGELTDTEKYGKGETLFLEVDAKNQHCSSGINQQCLKVREIYYDKNWIKSGSSDWKLMKQPIEGYTHDENTHNVLRVKKYITEPVDVKGKQLVYVLDMVVETGVAK